MIVIIKPGVKQQHIDKLIENLKTVHPVEIQAVKGAHCTILGLVGDTSHIDPGSIENRDIVDKVRRVSEPFKKVNRSFHPENTVIDVLGRKIGGKEIAIIAGPCSVETEDQIISIAKNVQKSGAAFLRGGAYKPRTSPYAFQGLEEDGLELLKIAKQKTDLPIVTEIMHPHTIDKFVADVDVIQVGARNMQNFGLLKELGQIDKPVLLKRGLSSTIEEWLMSAEYIMAGGNENVILCERGIRTFENYTRNTLDLSAIPAVKKLSHLPVIVDPSHATGLSWMVDPLACAAISAGADGLLIEVHNDPAAALCDGPQSLTPKAFDKLMIKLQRYAEIEGRTLTIDRA